MELAAWTLCGSLIGALLFIGGVWTGIFVTRRTRERVTGEPVKIQLQQPAQAAETPRPAPTAAVVQMGPNQDPPVVRQEKEAMGRLITEIQQPRGDAEL